MTIYVAAEPASRRSPRRGEGHAARIYRQLRTPIPIAPRACRGPCPPQPPPQGQGVPSMTAAKRGGGGRQSRRASTRRARRSDRRHGRRGQMRGRAGCRLVPCHRPPRLLDPARPRNNRDRRRHCGDRGTHSPPRRLDGLDRRRRRAPCAGRRARRWHAPRRNGGNGGMPPLRQYPALSCNRGCDRRRLGRRLAAPWGSARGRGAAGRQQRRQRQRSSPAGILAPRAAAALSPARRELHGAAAHTRPPSRRPAAPRGPAATAAAGSPGRDGPPPSSPAPPARLSRPCGRRGARPCPPPSSPPPPARLNRPCRSALGFSLPPPARPAQPPPSAGALASLAEGCGGGGQGPAPGPPRAAQPRPPAALQERAARPARRPSP